MEQIGTHLPEVTLIVRMLVSVLLGGLIGLEREYQGQSAGLRTYIILCLGGCIFMCISINSSYYGTLGDVERIAAQVISGVGFLGAAVIFNMHGNVRGLTNAVSIWTTAIIGLTTGSGLLKASVIATIIIIIVLSIFNYIETLFFYEKLAKVVTIKGINRIDFVLELEKIINRYNVILRNKTINRDDINQTIEIKFYIKTIKEKDMIPILNDMQKVYGVESLGYVSDNN